MVAPWETRIRFSDGTAQRLNCAASAALSLIIVILTGTGMCGSLPAKPNKRQNHPPKPDAFWILPTMSLRINVVPLGPLTSRAASFSRSRNSDKGNVGIVEVSLRCVHRDGLSDLFARARRRDDLHLRIAVLPDPCVEPVMTVRHDKEGGLAEILKSPHFVLVKRDSIENDEPPIAQTHDGHPPWDAGQWHWDRPDDCQDIVVNRD